MNWKETGRQRLGNPGAGNLPEGQFVTNQTKEEVSLTAERVLVVDDEPMVREVVSRYLELAGIDVQSVDNGVAALAAVRDNSPDLMVLDVMLPRLGGLDVLGELRRTSDIPVILLTANGDEQDRIDGFARGADDYVVKPFSPRELAARVRSVLRRTSSATLGRIDRNGLVVNPVDRAVQLDGEPVELVRREFDLLAYLASHPGQVFSRSQLLDQVWDSSPDWQDPATVTVHVRRVRNKLGNDPERFIQTVWGVGYRFAR